MFNKTTELYCFMRYSRCYKTFFMELRKKENVRPSGCISYKIQEKKWYGWKTIKSFTSRKERDEALIFINNSL